MKSVGRSHTIFLELYGQPRITLVDHLSQRMHRLGTKRCNEFLPLRFGNLHFAFIVGARRGNSAMKFFFMLNTGPCCFEAKRLAWSSIARSYPIEFLGAAIVSSFCLPNVNL